mgnify:CR=1 FL=1|jgi:tol-pal system-associated acyl-CoA thioesterase
MFIHECKVYVEDTDCGGVVYHPNYLKYMDRARSEMLASLGFNERLMFDGNFGFVVHKVEIDYERPAHVSDPLVIKTKLLEKRRVALLFEQSVYHKDTEIRLAIAKIRVACVNAAFRPIKIPEAISAGLTIDEKAT